MDLFTRQGRHDLTSRASAAASPLFFLRRLMSEYCQQQTSTLPQTISTVTGSFSVLEHVSIKARGLPLKRVMGSTCV